MMNAKKAKYIQKGNAVELLIINILPDGRHLNVIYSHIIKRTKKLA